MNIQDIASLAGIAAVLIGGANFVIIAIARTFWKLTFDKKEKDDNEKFKKIDERLSLLEEFESKNKYFRHNFDAVTQALEQHITREIKHLEEVIELKFKVLSKVNNN